MEDQRTMLAARRLFVGRLRELEDLASGLEEAAAGNGGLFMLVGPAGMGKTRLADEAGKAAAGRGWKVLWGRCWETGGAPAYWPWMQILRELARGPDGAALLAELGATARVLAPLIPEVVPPPDQAAGGDPVQARFRLFEAVVSLLRAAGARAPLFLVLDDLHTADPSSLALLHFLARALRGVRAVVVGTYRDEEARLQPEVGGVLTDVAREGVYLPLLPLSREEIAALVSGAAGQADPALVDAVERASEGNPLFLGELLRLLGARGDLAAGRSTAAGAGERLPIPDSAREVIGRRIARLGPETRAALAAGAVVGRDFALALLAAAAERPPEEVERPLAEAERSGLLAATGPGAWRFSHVLVREALYRDLDPAARAAAHERVAAALERTARPEEVAAQIAHHWLAALPRGDAARAAAAAQAAADQAMAMLAFEDAAMLLERARQALQATPAPNRRGLCELQLVEGTAWMRAGDVARGRAACLAAADEARRLGAGDLLARAALGYGAELMLAQTDPHLVALLEEALRVLPPGPSGWRAQVLARLAATLQPAPDVHAPIAMAREAIAMARGLGDEAILRTVLLAGGSALADYAPARERMEVSEELDRLAAAAGDRFQRMRALSRLVFDNLELGNVDQSARAVDGYEALAREFKQARHIWPGRLMRGMLASARGRFDEAAWLYDEAVAGAEADSDPTVAFVLAWCRCGLALESERPDQLAAAEEQLLRALDIVTFPTIPPEYVHMATVMLRARQGDLATARARLALLSENALILRDQPDSAGPLAEAVALTGDVRMARILYPWLLPIAGEIISHGRSGISCGGPADLALGMLAGTLGKHDEAERHLRAGLALAAAGALLPYLAQGRFWLARTLLARGGAGDGDAARALIAEARQMARTLGLGILSRRLDALEEPEQPTAAPAAPPAMAPPMSFAHEGEYWTITSGDEVCRLRDGRGVQILAELVAHPGREFHVLALSGGGAGDEGDAGEVLDATAIEDYRERVAELDEEIAEAESFADGARAGRAREEREAIARELAQGVGLGGRARRAGAAAERARTNVQRRLRGTIKKIGESIPRLGAYLDRTVRTGTFCSYDPL